MIGKWRAGGVAGIEIKSRVSPLMPVNGIVNMTGENDARRMTADGCDEVGVARIATADARRHRGTCRRGVDHPDVGWSALGSRGAADREQREAVEHDSLAVTPDERVVKGSEPIGRRPAFGAGVPFEVMIAAANAHGAPVGIDPLGDPLNLFRMRSDIVQVEQIARDHEQVVRGRLGGQPVVPMFGEMKIGDVKNFHGVSPRRVRSV